MSHNDDFMNYVGYNLYGGGNDSNFKRGSGCLGSALMFAVAIGGVITLAVRAVVRFM